MKYIMVKKYFRNNPKFGRITNLVDENNNVLYSGLGIWTKKDLIKAYEDRKENLKIEG